MSNPLVSVVMITYGHERFIEQAINSILLQQCTFEIELIIANDKSPDRSDTIIKKIISSHKKGKFIRYFSHEENLGMMANFIFALEKCEGKYVALCEGDDYWTDPFKLQTQVNLLEKDANIVACFTNAYFLNEMTNEKFLYNTTLKEGKIKANMIIETGGSIYPTASLMFARVALNLTHFKFLSDFDSGDEPLIYLLLNEGEIYYIDQITCVYRRWIGGIYSSISKNPLKIVELKKQNINSLEKYNKLVHYRFNKQIQKKISRNSFYIIKNGKQISNFKYFLSLNCKDFLKLLFFR